TPVPEKRITPSTAAVLNMAATLPLVFDAELNSIRERLNIMKASPHNNNVWGATYNTRNNVTASIPFIRQFNLFINKNSHLKKIRVSDVMKIADSD
ncbi:TPA: autotransporter outer membrane beta-barrel domain-containing protein, partial [Escherichia coli]